MKPPGNSTQPQLLDIPSISHPAGNTALCKGLVYSSCLQRLRTLLDPSFMLPSCTLQAATGLPSCKDKIPVPFKLLVFHQTTSLCYLCHLLISLLFPKTYTYINLLSPIPSLILGGLRAPQMMSHPVPLVLRLDHLIFSGLHYHFICPPMIPCHSSIEHVFMKHLAMSSALERECKQTPAVIKSFCV